MKGYKMFGPDWKCRGKQYNVGETFEEDLDPVACSDGMHFCKKAADCFHYYAFEPANKVAEIIAHGDIAEDGDKCATNKLEIVREIPWHELLDIVNTGHGNTGIGNTGDLNTGDLNTSFGNTGDWNSGDWNSGDWNSGDWNSGDRNTGNHNTGNRNTGNCNTGDWNAASCSTGCFNTEDPKLMFFDLPTDMTMEEWRDSPACAIMSRVKTITTEWICSEDMSAEKKEANPSRETTGGYLKEIDGNELGQEWWGKLTDEDKNIVKGIPNFDATKFKLIIGVDVEEGKNGEE